LGADWFLDRIEISSKERVWVFPCNKWLAKNRDDKQICRELAVFEDAAVLEARKRRQETLVAKSKSNPAPNLKDGASLATPHRINTNGEEKYVSGSLVPYDIRLTTASGCDGGGTQIVYLQFYGGVDGSITTSGPLQLTPRTPSLAFLRGSTDQFLISAPDVGNVTHVKIWTTGTRPWLLEALEIRIPSRKPVLARCDAHFGAIAPGSLTNERTIHFGPKEEVRAADASATTPASSSSALPQRPENNPLGVQTYE
jgi:hypothetical protein